MLKIIKKHGDKIAVPALTSALLSIIEHEKIDSKYNYIASFIAQAIVFLFLYSITIYTAKKIKEKMEENDSEIMLMVNEAIDESTKSMEFLRKENKELDEDAEAYHKLLLKQKADITISRIKERIDYRSGLEKEYKDIVKEIEDDNNKINTQIENVISQDKKKK